MLGRALAVVLIAGTGGGVASAPTPDPAKTFAQNCAACHQIDGKGIPGAFPALAGDKLANGKPELPIAVVLNGRGGMPSFRDALDDAQIAAALSHVRTSWGNKAGRIDPALVAKVRGSKAQVKEMPLLAH